MVKFSEPEHNLFGVKPISTIRLCILARCRRCPPCYARRLDQKTAMRLSGFLSPDINPLRNAGLRRICVWPSLGAKRGEGPNRRFSPYFQGVPEDMSNCQFLSGTPGT